MSKQSGAAAPVTAEERDVTDDVLANASAILGMKTFPGSTTTATAEADDETDGPDADDAGDDDADEKPVAKAKPSAKAAAPADDDDAADDDDQPATDEADEDDAAATEDDAEAELSDEEKEAAALAQATAALVNSRLKDLPEPVRQRVQAVLDARIGKITAKAKAEAAQLTTRVDALAAELEEAKAAQPATAAPALPGVHPLFFAESETVLETRLAEIENFEDFAADHPDGFEGDPAKNLPAWTPESIRRTLRDLQKERDRVIPAVRANLRARAASDVELKKTFAPMFDRTREEYRSAQALLKTMPELRRHPEANVLVAQLILGQRALAALKKPAAKSEKLAAVIRKAPRVPGAGAPARGGAADHRSSGPDSSAAVAKFMQDPKGRGFAAAVESFL
jgi:hypothetical protein